MAKGGGGGGGVVDAFPPFPPPPVAVVAGVVVAAAVFVDVVGCLEPPPARPLRPLRPLRDGLLRPRALLLVPPPCLLPDPAPAPSPPPPFAELMVAQAGRPSFGRFDALRSSCCWWCAVAGVQRRCCASSKRATVRALSDDVPL